MLGEPLEVSTKWELLMGSTVDGRFFFTYVSQHVLKTFGLPSLAVCAVFACVFGVFLAEV